jgi:hypothetical protein
MSQLPSGWHLSTVGAVTEPVETVKPKLNPAQSFSYVDIGSIDNSTQTIVSPKTLLGEDAPSRARQLLRQGDTVFSTVRTYLRNIGYVTSEFDGAIGSTGFSVLRPAQGISSRYLHYYTVTNGFVDGLSAVMRGTSYPAVVDSQVRAMPIPIAPSTEQERIVAAIEERFSRLEVAEALLVRSKARFDGLRSSLITSATEGDWPRQPWKDVGTSQNGRAFPSRDYTDGGVRLLRPGNLDASGHVVWTQKNTRQLPATHEKEFPSYVVGPNELVMNLTAQSLKDEFLGRVCLTGPDEHSLLNQRLARLTPLEVDARFLLFVFKGRPFRRFVDALNKGTLIQHMFTSQIADFAVPTPTLDEQRGIVAEIDRRLSVVDSMADQVEKALCRCAALRRAILQWAFSGNLVGQDPADEPASVLLERIAAEQAESDGQEPRRTRQRSREAMA